MQESVVASCNVAVGGLCRPLEAKEKEVTNQEFQRIPEETRPDQETKQVRSRVVV